jgi:outer membrane protein insertion porin family
MDQSTTQRRDFIVSRENNIRRKMSFGFYGRTAAFRAALLLLAIGSTVLLPQRAIAQPAQVPGYAIVEIEVVGAKNTSADLIKSVAGLLPGATLNAAAARDAVTQLDGLGLFDDIAILLEEVSGGVKLYIQVTERAKLTALNFVGRDKVGEDDLRDEAKLLPGSYVTGFTFFNTRQRLLELYADKGYYLTEISYTTTYNADSSEVSAIYTITENEKIKIRSVHLTGSQRMDSSSLVGVMSNRKKGFLKSSNYNKSKYQEDLDKIVAEYQKHGYIDAYIVSDSTRIDTVANRMDIFIETFEGPRYYFGEATFTDNDVYTDELLARALKHKTAQVFDQEKYDESIFELYSAYQERGYLHVRILDERKYRDSIIDIEYQIIEGLPSKVNLVSITGNYKTKDRVIRRELSALPGQTFHRSLLMRSLRDVMALNYFTNVVPDVKDLPSGDVDIVLEVEEKQTGQLNAGAGYSARDGMVGTFGMGIPNFRGMGQALNFNLEFGGRRNSSQISFTEPWMFGRPTLLGVDVFMLNREFFESYTEGRRGGSLRIGKRLRWPDNYFRVSASYRIEGDRFHDFSPAFVARDEIVTYTNRWTETEIVTLDTVTISPDTITTYDTVFVNSLLSANIEDTVSGSLLEFGEQWKLASALTFSITRDSRNLPEFATSGSRFRYTITKAGGFMGGFWNYTKHFVEFSKFFRIYKGIALAAKSQFGAVLAPTSRGILESERFSPGGTSYVGIVRGYDDGSLTPDTLITAAGDVTLTDTLFLDSTSTPVTSSTANPFMGRVRGNYLFATNWEISVPLATNTLYFLMFADAGGSWTTKDRIEIWPGAGVGFRLAVPGIGTIGFDFGYPLRKTSTYNSLTGETTLDSQGWRSHFQIGTVFR